jgi:hypothetical protein
MDTPPRRCLRTGLMLAALAALPATALASPAPDDPLPLTPVQDPAPADPDPQPLIVGVALGLNGGS